MNPDDDLARRRWQALILLRLVGTVMAMAGALLYAGRLGASLGPKAHVAGAVLLAVGVFDAMIMPLILARKWKNGGR